MSVPKTVTVSPLQEKYAQYQIVRGFAVTGYQKFQQWKQRKLDATRYYVAVEEEDEMFEQLLRWLMKDISFDEQRSIIARTDRRHDGDSQVADLLLVTDTDYVSEMQIGGRTIAVEVTTQKVSEMRKPRGSSSDPLSSIFSTDDDESYAPGNGMASAYMREQRVVFTCADEIEREIVIEHLKSLLPEVRNRTPSFYTAASYGGFRRTNHVMRRPIDSVILADDGIERVIADLDSFIKEEDHYIEMGLPWHHGYLFHGPPGTGKTSLATGLANLFKLDVYYIPLSTISDDSKLMDLINEVSGRQAMLIMEDIDIVHATQERSSNDDKETTKGVTLTGLLNALDGISTPHGLIAVLTTNRIDVLDPALIRPGRVDFSLEIGYVTDDQVQRICQRFLGEMFDLPGITGNITPAEIIGLFKSSDKAEVHKLLENLITEKNAIDD